MPPMRFVVALEPFVFADEHRYFVAERGDDVVAFLSAVPVYATRGWLVEDLPRNRRAPNGTVEMLLDAMMRDAAESESVSAFATSFVSPNVSPYVSMGLAPLTGPVSAFFRLARFVGRPLYDFRGLRSFKERLRPSSWRRVCLAFPRSEMAALHVVESLRAFAGGSLVAFGLRTLGRLRLHPSGPPWALAVPLVPWTLLLRGRRLLGQSRSPRLLRESPPGVGRLRRAPLRPVAPERRAPAPAAPPGLGCPCRRRRGLVAAPPGGSRFRK
jgi:hypothetical protein